MITNLPSVCVAPRPCQAGALKGVIVVSAFSALGSHSFGDAAANCTGAEPARSNKRNAMTTAMVSPLTADLTLEENFPKLRTSSTIHFLF
jgi:hypothetical protein